MNTIKIALTALALTSTLATAALADGPNGGPGNHVTVQTDTTITGASVNTYTPTRQRATDATTAQQSIPALNVRLTH